MESSYQKAAILMMLVLCVAIGNNVVSAQTICNVSAQGLMACRPAATPPNPPPPTAVCCSAISHADFKCLCSYKNSKFLPSLGIDPNLAFQVPAKCKLPQPVKC